MSYRGRILTSKQRLKGWKKSQQCKSGVKRILERRKSRCRGHKVERIWCARGPKGRPAGWGKEKEGILANDEGQEVDGSRLCRQKKIFILSTIIHQ